VQREGTVWGIGSEYGGEKEKVIGVNMIEVHCKHVEKS
jgi:hypothetical protein